MCAGPSGRPGEVGPQSELVKKGLALRGKGGEFGEEEEAGDVEKKNGNRSRGPREEPVPELEIQGVQSLSLASLALDQVALGRMALARLGLGAREEMGVRGRWRQGDLGQAGSVLLVVIHWPS